MKIETIVKNSRFTAAPILWVLLVIAASNTYAMASAAQLEDDYQTTTSTAYRELSGAAEFKLTSADLVTLINEMITADNNLQSDRVAALAIANMAVVQAHINDKKILDISRLLLKNHAVSLAKDILTFAKQNGNRHTQAKQNLAFAKYFATQQRWDEAIAHLKTFDLTNDLSSQDTDAAHILVGAALQAKKKHRDALAYYAKVKPGSPHYMTAQLDMALVYIRQDWWTDAQITLEDAIEAAAKDDFEMVNRLYTVMGFSQLQQGFYRNARETFRQVKINSAYSHRALLGIGMAALNQEDYTGAVNAFQQLKYRAGNDSIDTSVAQSYLLEAFTLTKTQQNGSAADKYNQAVQYYESKRNYYAGLLNTLEDSTPSALSADAADLAQETTDIKTLTEKLSCLRKLHTYPLSKATLQQINVLQTQLHKMYVDATREALTKKQLVFNSYLNQANFGLTRLYDNH